MGDYNIVVVNDYNSNAITDTQLSDILNQLLAKLIIFYEENVS